MVPELAHHAGLRQRGEAFAHKPLAALILLALAGLAIAVTRISSTLPSLVAAASATATASRTLLPFDPATASSVRAE